MCSALLTNATCSSGADENSAAFRAAHLDAQMVPGTCALNQMQQLSIAGNETVDICEEQSETPVPVPCGVCELTVRTFLCPCGLSHSAMYPCVCGLPLARLTPPLCAHLRPRATVP